MPISLYDVTVPSYEQVITAMEGVLAKGATFSDEKNVSRPDLVGARLHDDMLPLQFQVISIAHHSLGALRGALEGGFTPPPSLERDYEGLQRLLADARAGLAEFSPDVVNGFMGKEVLFKIGDVSMPFVAEDFFLSFSLPNFYFHATTAYDILRARGVALGKRDFLGGIRLKG